MQERTTSSGSADQPKLRADLVFRIVDEDLVVYDPLTDRTSLLNPSAATILEFCDGTRDARAIAGALRAALERAPESLEHDVEKLIVDLRGQGFFEVRGSPG